MTRQITREQYLQVLGLLALAKHEIEVLKRIALSLESVFGVTDADRNTSGIGDPQHIDDAAYSDYSAEELLQKLGVSVADAGPWTPQ